MSVFVSGESHAQWVAGDFGLRRGSGCDARGCQQRRSDPNGERRPRLPQAGAGQPDGRLEILHLLRLPCLPPVEEGLATEGLLLFSSPAWGTVEIERVRERESERKRERAKERVRERESVRE